MSNPITFTQVMNLDNILNWYLSGCNGTYDLETALYDHAGVIFGIDEWTHTWVRNDETVTITHTYTLMEEQ